MKQPKKTKPRLQFYLDLINAIPLKANLPDLSLFYEKIEGDETFQDSIKDLETEERVYKTHVKLNELLFERLREISRNDEYENLSIFLNIIRADLDPKNKYHKAANIFSTYNEYKEIRAFYKKIILLREIHQTGYEDYGENVHSWQQIKIEKFITIHAYEKNGYIEISTPEHVEALKGAELMRIKVCQSCGRVFYAKKITGETCGRRACVNALYNRTRLEEAEAAKKKEKVKNQTGRIEK